MILHIDMDAFFASVEERENPRLRGRPLAVGGRAEARGVVAAANYPARKFGIHSAMPMSQAVRRCPQLRILPTRGALYAQVAAQIREIFNRYTPVIEPLSLDEAFLDPSGSLRLHGSAEQIGRAIKADIRAELGLVASVGVAPNKFLAKLASDFDKPDGFTLILPEQAQAFLDPLPVARIWGVGKSAQAKLAKAGIHTVAELRQSSEDWLNQTFGKHGGHLWRLAHGIDERKVAPDSEVKSISQEITFAADIRSHDALQSVLSDLTEQVCYRMRKQALRGKTVQLKIRRSDFSTTTHARSLSNPSNTTAEIWRIARDLLAESLRRKTFALRLIGVGVSNFCADRARQADLFQPQGSSRAQDLDQLTDQIKTRYGKSSIRRGKSLQVS